MERDIKIIYRVAEKANKNNKLKPEWINNETCLRNIAKYATDAELIVFGDRLTETKEVAQNVSQLYFDTTRHGNAETFLEVLDYALTFDDQAIVYFVEDDYIHRPGFTRALQEGLRIADYVSLYDHLDKYQAGCYAGSTYLWTTKSTHWREVGSTTMTFATTVKTLRFDYQIFKEMTEGQEMPPDYFIWQALRGEDRRLITPLPGFSTHGETKFLSPVINWEQYI